MATRVLVRCVRVLSRTSSYTPVVTSRLLPIFAAEVHRSPLWAIVGERHLCDTSTVIRQGGYQAMPSRTPLDDLLDEATESEDILQAWAEYPGTGNQAARVFRKLAHLVINNDRFKEQFPELLADRRLKNILTTLSKEVSKVWNGNLVSALQAMWIIKLPPTHPVLHSIQTETLWRIRRFSYKQLGHLIEWGADKEGKQNKDIVNAALKQLELRWTEIANAKTISGLIRNGECMSSTLLNKLEDKALEFAESFSSEDIRKIFVSLAVQRRRPVPLLRALSYHLLQKPSSDFTTPLMLDVAFAYAKLSFHNTQVFQHMASELLPRVAELSSSEVVRLAKSFGFLKWLHFPLFEAFAKHFIKKNDSYSVFELSNLLMTFARLGFQPVEADNFFTLVHSSLENSLSSLEPFLQTDVAWSLCVLQQARPQYLIPLLKEQHISTLTREIYLLKLLHITASLQLEHPGSFDTVSSQNALGAHPTEGLISGVTPLQTALREALHNLVKDREDALRVGVDTVYGWNIDGEMVVDSDYKPLSLTCFKAPHLPHGGGEEPLPQGVRRIAFLAWEFPSFVVKSKDLLGRFVMKKRHLQLAGFITVEVPYFEWHLLKTDYQKVSYLKDKIGKAVAEDVAK